MIKDITLGQYIPGDSIIHKSDPRTKILLTLAYMIVIFLVTNYLGYALLGALTIAAVLISRIPFSYILRGLKPILVLLIFTMVINLFTVQGTVIFQMGFIKLTWEGIELSLKLAIRLIILVISASLLTNTTTPILMTDGMEKLLQPFSKIGMPVHEISMIISIAIRFIPTLIDETEKIIKAQSARGADFDTGNIFQKAKSYIPVLIPLFISAFRRADDLAIAMEARCYRGSEGRTRMKQLKFSRADLILSLSCTIFFLVIIYVGR